MPTLADVERHRPVAIVGVDGERGFRRRLMELGLCPGTTVAITNVAPLGDPLEIEVRGGRLSIRKDEAAQIRVRR
jgi:Fe2+ transport system protein FeoA